MHFLFILAGCYTCAPATVIFLWFGTLLYIEGVNRGRGIKIQFFPENGCQKRKMLSVLVYLPGCFKFPGRPFDCIQNSYRGVWTRGVPWTRNMPDEQRRLPMPVWPRLWRGPVRVQHDVSLCTTCDESGWNLTCGDLWPQVKWLSGCHSNDALQIHRLTRSSTKEYEGPWFHFRLLDLYHSLCNH